MERRLSAVDGCLETRPGMCRSGSLQHLTHSVGLLVKVNSAWLMRAHDEGQLGNCAFSV